MITRVKGTNITNDTIGSTQIGDLTDVTIQASQEYIQSINGGSGTVTYDCGTSLIKTQSGMTANWGCNFANLAIDSTRAVVVTLILTQGSTAYLPTAAANVLINGTNSTAIKWLGGNSSPTGTASQTDVASFTIINTGSGYVVLGQVASYS